MSVEKAIRNYLLTRPAVTDVVTAERIKPDVIDQDWKPIQGPFVTYEFISSDEEHTLAPDRLGFVSARMQFVVCAGTRMTANATARAIKNCGVATLKGTYSGVSIRGVEIESGLRTYYEKPDDGKDEYRYFAEFDLMVHYLEA